MSDRTALVISCSQEQAASIHRRAELERRPVSGYVLRILMRAVDLEEKISALQRESPAKGSVVLHRVKELHKVFVHELVRERFVRTGPPGRHGENRGAVVKMEKLDVAGALIRRRPA